MQQVQDFVDSDPMNVIVKDMLHKYESQTEEVLSLPERHIIGSIQIDMGRYSLNDCLSFTSILYSANNNNKA